MYSPDKKQLAFVSTRTGGGDVYVLTLASGDVRRITYEDGQEQLDGWSRDGKWLYFFSSARELAGNVNDWIARIGELAELGASRLWLSTEAGDLDRQIHYMRVFTEQIMPHFK